MDKVVAHDWTGGQAARLSATHFTERQWARLYGAVLESDTELRSQWPWQSVGVSDGFVQVAHVDGLLVALDADGAVHTAPEPALDATLDTLGAVTWTALSAAGTASGRRITGLVPLPRYEGLGFVTALLVNGIGRSGEAGAVYVDPSTSNPAWFGWETSYPNDTNTAGMPKANLSTMWGDSLVLADVEWTTEDGTFNSGNASRYPHALWLSQPAEPDRFDLLDVIYTGLKDGRGEPHVLGLETVDAGLLILTTAGIYMLRGTPSSFEYEELRVGQGPAGLDATDWWSAPGAAVWANRVGQIWHTNGSVFLRLDEPLGLNSDAADTDWVAGWDEFLLAGRQDRVFAFRMFTQDGAWTELEAPAGFGGPITVGPCIYGLDEDGLVWRLNRAATARGLIDGEAVTVRVGSRTFEGGDGHRLTFWRNFGVRVQPETGSPLLEKVTLYAGPVLADTSPSYVYMLNREVSARGELVVPGHGASLEAAVEFQFQGDVTVEQVTAMFNQARGSL